MLLRSTTFEKNQRIPERCAFGVPDEASHMRLGENRNPQLQWNDIPDGTKSLVLLCVDPDMPSVLDDFNQEGRSISASLPRVDFYHWAMVDIPAGDGSVVEGECSDGIVAGGKPNPAGPPGCRQGINDYTGFMASDPEMKGDYYGYEGPCPPWNDEIVHHYHFVLYATDLKKCPVDDRFTGADVQKAIEGHVLAEARLIGVYWLNPSIG